MRSSAISAISAPACLPLHLTLTPNTDPNPGPNPGPNPNPNPSAQLGNLALEVHFFSMFAPGFVSGRLIAAAGPARTSWPQATLNLALDLALALSLP